MRKLLLLAFWFVGGPLAAGAAPTVDANLASPKEANSIDLGCLRGDLRATKFPTQTYDQATHERVMYNISRCTGGFIMGTNTDTWKSWHADVRPDGSMSGLDADGAKWTYDHKTRLYTNLTSGRTCEQANLRHVCAQ
jgi:hypothetical protein